jgi:hypothetical protein
VYGSQSVVPAADVCSSIGYGRQSPWHSHSHGVRPTLSFARRATSSLFSNRHGSRRLDANFAVFSYVHTYIRGYLSAVDDFLVAQLASFLRSFFRGLPLGSESPFGCDAL